MIHEIVFPVRDTCTWDHAYSGRVQGGSLSRLCTSLCKSLSKHERAIQFFLWFFHFSVKSMICVTARRLTPVGACMKFLSITANSRPFIVAAGACKNSTLLELDSRFRCGIMSHIELVFSYPVYGWVILSSSLCKSADFGLEIYKQHWWMEW